MSQGFRIQNFGGLVPRVAPELLPDAAAQISVNARLYSGDLIPYRRPSNLLNLSGFAAQTIYPMLDNETYYWLMWASDVNVVRAAAANVVNNRIYYTGDGAPKATDINRATFKTTKNVASGYTVLVADYETTLNVTGAGAATINVPAAATAGPGFAVCVKNSLTSGDVTVSGTTLTAGESAVVKTNGSVWTVTKVTRYPYDYFTIGLPKPATKPVANYDAKSVAAGYTVLAADNNYTIEVTASGTLNFSAAATLGNQFFVLVRNKSTGDVTLDPNGTELINNATTVALKSGDAVFVNSNGTALFTSTAGSFVSWVYTWVNAWGEESRPSDPTDILFHTSGLRMALSSLPTTAPIGEQRITKYRLYRAVTGTRGTTYQLVTEQTIGAGTGTYTDTVKTADLAEALESQKYDIPDPGMLGLVNMANGMSAGFVGNEVVFSEPYQPHAWNAEYRYAVESPVVALGAVGNSLVIVTETVPVVASGNTPDSITLTPLDTAYPCLSKRGLVDTGRGVMYPSYDGLVLVTGTSARLETSQVMTKEEWRRYNPESLNAVFYQGQYHAFYELADGTKASFIFQPSSDGIPLLMDTTVYGTASYADTRLGEMFFVAAGFLQQWDAAEEVTFVDWKSKEMVLTTPTNFGAAQIRADFPDTLVDTVAEFTIDGSIAADEINAIPVAGLKRIEGISTNGCVFMLYVNGQLKFSRTVSDSKVFRLPAGYKADRYSVRVSAPFRIRAILVGESPLTLKEL